MQGLLKVATTLAVMAFFGVGIANAEGKKDVSESKVDDEMEQVLHTLEGVQEQLQALFIWCDNTNLPPTECQRVVLLELSEYFITIVYAEAAADSYSAVLQGPDRTWFRDPNRSRTGYYAALVALNVTNSAVQRYLATCGEAKNPEEMKQCRGKVLVAVIEFITEIIPVVVYPWDVPEF